MSIQRNIRVAIGTILLLLLLSSTSVSSFAATNTITSGKFQSDTVKLPVESIPSRQLNFTQEIHSQSGYGFYVTALSGVMRYIYSGQDARTTRVS